MAVPPEDNTSAYPFYVVIQRIVIATLIEGMANVEQIHKQMGP